MLLKWARCYILTRGDGLVRGYTEHDRKLIVDGVVCSPVRAVNASSAEHRVGGGVDTVDIQTVFDGADITRPDVEAGLWDGAKLRVILFNWSDRTIVREFLTYSVADAAWKGGEVSLTLESLGAVALNRKTGQIGAPNCGWTFGGEKCGVDRSANRTTMDVTAVDRQTLTGTVPSPSAGQWQGGFVVFGDEAVPIVFTDGATIYLEHPFAMAPVSGDSVTLEPGCGKTALQCKTFENFDRFGGHGHRAPNASAVTEVADSQDGQEFDGGSRFES